MTQRATACGLDGVLLVTRLQPPSQAGIFDTSGRGRGGEDLAVVSTTSRADRRRIAMPTMLRLAREVARSRRSRRRQRSTRHGTPCRGGPAGFEMYSGDDVMALPSWRLGGRRHQRGRALVGPSSAASWTPSWRARSPLPSPKGGAAGLLRLRVLDQFRSAAGQGDAACPGAPRRPVPPGDGPSTRTSTPRPQKILAAVGPTVVTVAPLAARGNRPKVEPVRVLFLGGLGEMGRNCACIEVEAIIILTAGSCSLIRTCRHRPGPARFDLSPRPEGPGRRGSCSRTGTRTIPRPGSCWVRSMHHLRLRADGRPGPPRRRGGRACRPHHVDPVADGAPCRSAPATPSSSR